MYIDRLLFRAYHIQPLRIFRVKKSWGPDVDDEEDDDDEDLLEGGDDEHAKGDDDGGPAILLAMLFFFGERTFPAEEMGG